MQMSLGDAVAEASQEFVHRLAGLHADRRARRGIMKIGIRRVAWHMAHEFGDKQALCDQLAMVTDEIRGAEDEPEED